MDSSPQAKQSIVHTQCDSAQVKTSITRRTLVVLMHLGHPTVYCISAVILQPVAQSATDWWLGLCSSHFPRILYLRLTVHPSVVKRSTLITKKRKITSCSCLIHLFLIKCDVGLMLRSAMTPLTEFAVSRIKGQGHRNKTLALAASIAYYGQMTTV